MEQIFFKDIFPIVIIIIIAGIVYLICKSALFKFDRKKFLLGVATGFGVWFCILVAMLYGCSGVIGMRYHLQHAWSDFLYQFIFSTPGILFLAISFYFIFNSPKNIIRIFLGILLAIASLIYLFIFQYGIGGMVTCG